MHVIGEPRINSVTRRVSCDLPEAVIDIDLQQTYQSHRRNVAAGQTTIVRCPPVPIGGFQLRIPLYALSQSSEYLNRYILSQLSYINLEHRHLLTPKIGAFAALTGFGSSRGFYIKANMVIPCGEVVDVGQDMELMMTFDAEDVVRNMGASRSVIDKLKKERRVVGGVGAELGTCMVCLEELSDVVELIKMPCSHLFHESCVFRWLEEKNSCPICRHEVNDMQY